MPRHHSVTYTYISMKLDRSVDIQILYFDSFQRQPITTSAWIGPWRISGEIRPHAESAEFLDVYGSRGGVPAMCRIIEGTPKYTKPRHITKYKSFTPGTHF